MEYHQDDSWLLGVKDEGSKVGWWSVVFLVLLILGNLALVGCDSQAAENTAIAEAEAHQRHVELIRAVMDCDATVTQSVFTGIPLKQGCYVRGVLSKEKK